MTALRSSFLTAIVLTCSMQALAADGEQLGWALMLKPMCEQHMEGFAAKSKQAYANLRRTYPEAFANYEANPPMAAAGPMNSTDLEQLQSHCESILDYLLNSGRPADPRLATPEQTWKLFIGALRSADRETLAACFTPSDRLKYMKTFRELKPSELAGLADTFTSFKPLKAGDETYQEVAVQTTDGMVGIVLFVHSAAGWRISQL